MGNNQSEEIEIDLREIFVVLMSRIYIIIGVAVVCALVAGLVTKLCITPQYQSTTKLYVLSKGEDSGSAVSSALTSLTDLQLGSQVLLDYQVMITSRPVLEKVIDNLELDMEYQELSQIIGIVNPDQTRSIEITVTYPDPKIAKEISDELASVSAEYASEIMDVQPPRVFESGKVAEHQSSPNLLKNIIIAMLVGIIITCAIIVVLQLLDDTIKSQEDVEKYLGLNTLGLIPIEEGAVNQMKKDKRKRIRDMKK